MKKDQLKILIALRIQSCDKKTFVSHAENVLKISTNERGKEAI